MKQNDGFGDVDQFQGPVQCGITTTTDNEIFSPEQFRVFDTVKELGIFELLDTIHFQGAWLESADAGRDENGFGNEFLANGCFQIETAILAAFDLDDFFSEMEGRAERLDLFHQVFRQFKACIGRNRRNVVNRFVGIQFNALAADSGQGIDDVRLDFEQS